tara:strand:- start:2005 stop:2967 length:963 start_codon:yes stop_codon:yes gene_type:complete
MPFEKINLGEQTSQPMEITAIYDDYLVCKMEGYDPSKSAVIVYDEETQLPKAQYTLSTLTDIKVSKPCGLRMLDVDKDDDFESVDGVVGIKRVIPADLDFGGAKLKEDDKVHIVPPYKIGETIYVTKTIGNQMDPKTSTSGPFRASRGGGQEKGTVDVFVDENREGRSWNVAGKIEGFSDKCIVICENGEEVKGTILWKDGCDGEIDGGGGGSTPLASQEYCIECSSPGVVYDDPNEGPVGETKKWYVKQSSKAADNPSAARDACQTEADDLGISGTGGDINAVDVDFALCQQQSTTPATAAPAAAPQNFQIIVNEEENP